MPNRMKATVEHRRRDRGGEAAVFRLHVHGDLVEQVFILTEDFWRPGEW
jgi:hypothetical protein